MEKYILIDINPYIVQFSENFGIRWYGFSYLMGFVAAYLLLNYYYKKGKSPIDTNGVSNLIMYLAFGVILGGRLGYMFFYDLDAFLANPLTAFKIWNGGMASHGGFIGCLVAGILYSKVYKIPFLKIADLVTSVAPLGLFFGRMANFINGELYGKVSSVAWAMRFPDSMQGVPYSKILPRHPSQLYEGFSEGLFLFCYLQLRFWLGNNEKKSRNIPTGQLAGEFFVLYSICRIVCEIFREPDKGVNFICGLQRGTFFSAFSLILGILLIIIARSLHFKKASKNEEK